MPPSAPHAAPPAGLTHVVLEPACTDTLLSWHARFAQNPSALAALPTMTHQLRLPGVPGGVGLQRVGPVLVAAEPLAAPDTWPALMAALLFLAAGQGMTACFGPVGAEGAAVLRGLGLLSVRLGSTPYIHLRDYPRRGNAGASIRYARNRAAREGVQCREVTALAATGPEVTGDAPGAEMQALRTAWLRRRRAHLPFHWIFRLEPLEYAGRKRYFVARQRGRLLGFVAASPLPGRDCWYLEDVVLTRRAPAQSGTALVDFALLALKESGVPLATLGGVPLSVQRGWEAGEGPLQPTLQERTMYRLRPLLSLLYSFDGLELFKRRFAPAHWEDEFLVLPPDLPANLRVGRALARLVLRGR